MTSAVHVRRLARHRLTKALCLSLALPTALLAQEPPQQDPHRQDMHQLDSVVVTASPLHQTADALVRPVEVLAGEKLDEAKTKLMVKFLGNFELTKNTMLVLPGRDENVVRAGNNLQQLQTLYVNTLNVYDILKAGKIILTQDALKGVEEVYA